MEKFITGSKIRRHLNNNKDWINRFDVRSKNLTETGLLHRDESWKKESLIEDRIKKLFLYGVNSKGQFFALSLKTEPVVDSKNEILCLQYNFEIFLNTENGNQYNCSESGILYNLCDNKYEFKFPGLLLEVLEPFQRWRIKFNGIVLDQNEKRVWLRMRWLWISNSEVFDYRTTCDTNYLTQQTNGFQLTVDDIFEDRFVGCGQLKGILQIEDQSEEQIFLWGSRSLSSLLTANQEFEETFDKNILMAYSEKGMAFELIKIISKKTNKSLHYGWATLPHGTIHPIQHIHLTPEDTSQQPFPKVIRIKVSGRTQLIENLTFNPNKTCCLSLNGHKANGFLIEKNKNYPQIESDVTLIELFKAGDSQELVLPFENRIASNERLSGGKGSSLSLLKSLAEIMDNEFVVPNGFVVTTNAYQMLLRENPDLNKAIEKLQSISWSETKDNFENECKNLMKMFSDSKIPLMVKSSIKDNLKKLDKNGNYDDILVAVRSSACGEDSEDMSAAGQMSTYLGVKGLEQVCESVLKCWSSQFNLIAVEYKRGYGQPIDTPMAVVVQEMIDSDVAGVMFTCDPITGAPNRINISANYGIGESVVSAAVNPDNISLLVDMNSNSYQNDRRIKSIDKLIIGAKESAIKISKNIGSGTEVEVNSGEKGKCCLSEEQAIKLGDIGLKVQRYYGSIRDIEWGLKDEKYYLFQSRPVTHLNAYNEWELSHEFDSGHLDELEYNTRANLGEVMPGAISPLSYTSILRSMWSFVSDKFSRGSGISYNPHRKFTQAITIHNYSAFFSMKDAGFFEFAPEEYETAIQKGLVLSCFGHPVEDEQLRSDSFERNGIPPFGQKFIKIKDVIKDVIFSKRELSSITKKYNNIDLTKDKNFENSRQIFDHLSNNLFIIAEVMMTHMNASLKSSLQNLILLSLLSNGNIDIKRNPDLLVDFANLLSTTGHSIVSADVPTAIRVLAKSIVNVEEFKQLSPEEGVQWLENNGEETGKLYKEFITNFGFRGYKEYDVFSKTWRDKKQDLVTTIQAMLPLRQTETVVTTDKPIDRLKTQLSGTQKYFLKHWLLPSCHSSVALREEAKAFSVKCIDKFRVLFRQMARIMCYREGRLPEPDLIYFLTFNELKVLTESRDPRLVMKAKQRKRIHSKLDKLIYQEISIGPDIKPRNTTDKNSMKSKYLNGPNSLLTGTPVCTGSVTAKVCVAKTIDEANKIESGDILVTYSTDIGWSPYLPMISGIITEIGGLVSHGAVIAREYGIPCLVGVDNACELLSTGDTILLDADNSQIALMRTIDN